MSLAAQVNELFATQYQPHLPHAEQRFSVGIAESDWEIESALRLRYQVFVEEMGARANPNTPGIETDHFDSFCQHLVVRDHETARIVGCYRILTDEAAGRIGSFYSESEFDLSRVLTVPGRIMEVGRTCVDADYRNGAVIALLWAGLARYMVTHKFDYLMGCASITLDRGIDQVAAIYRQLAARHMAPPERQVFPKVGLTGIHSRDIDPDIKIEVPPLIKGYTRLGAQICGEPAWDPDFNVADLFILLDIRDLNIRYMRHFISRV